VNPLEAKIKKTTARSGFQFRRAYEFTAWLILARKRSVPDPRWAKSAEVQGIAIHHQKN
jgi:hypothetical protein